jgi:hypothetical protein
MKVTDMLLLPTLSLRFPTCARHQHIRDYAGQVYPLAEPYTDNLKEVATEPNVNA